MLGWQVEISHGRSIDNTEMNATTQVLLRAYHWNVEVYLVPGTVNSPRVGSGSQTKPSGKEMQVLVVEGAALGKSEEMWTGH